MYKSPAKINLFLEIDDTIVDGLHPIDTIMCKIDLCDLIYLEESENFTVITESTECIEIQHNLISKAYETIVDVTGFIRTPKVTLNKRIPVGYGLGGGSSNFATFIKAYFDFYRRNDLFQKFAEEIITKSWKFGSDIPFFFSNSSCAKVTDFGKKIESVHASQSETPIVVIYPEFCTSTVLAYNELNSSIPKKYLPGIQNTNSFDFQLRSSKYKSYVDALIPFTKNFSLTGSGSAIIVNEPSDQKREQVLTALESNDINYCVTTINN